MPTPAHTTLARLRTELPPMLHLALPLILAEIGWMSMGMVDTVMVGRLPHPAIPIGAVALAQVLYNTLVLGAGTVLLALDTVVAQAHGAGRIADAGRWLFSGIALALGLSAALVVLLLLAPIGMRRMPADPVVLAQAIRTLRALTPGILPLLVYFALRRYLQAFNHARVIAAALLSANLVNLLLDWLLIFPHGAFAGLGAVGSGIATSLARLYQLLFLLVALHRLNRRHGYGLRRLPRSPDWRRLRTLLRLGLPIGATTVVEIAIFALVTFLISTVSPRALAGHEIALNCVSFTFMVPLGLSAAAGVRVGQAIGRRDPAAAQAAGFTAIALAAAFMLLAAAALLLAPHAIARVFTPDPGVIAATVPIFSVAALFQLFDGVQVTALGALRGAGDTRSGLLTHLATYWLLGMPLGIFLAFRRGWGAVGLWSGISLALVLAGVVLLTRWSRVSRNLALARP